MNEWMNEWMMYLYSALLCIAIHPKRYTIMWGGGGSLLNHHQCAASTWISQQQPQDSDASALTTQLRESHRAQCALTTHQLQVRERVIEPIKCMLSPHTSYRWRGERVIEHQVYALTTHQLHSWEERESMSQSSVMPQPTHQLQVRERVMSQSSVMRSPHTSYRWRRESHRANQVYALTTHQLQVERRESHRANQVYALTTHQLQVEERES